MTARAKFANIPIGNIRPGRNVRKRLTHIDDLAASLVQHGMLQPITVIPAERTEQVEVLFGHRRFAAAKKAGLDTVPCFLAERGDRQTRLLAQAAENFDREDMTPLDEAHLFADLAECGLSQMQIAAKTRRSQTHVSRYLLLFGRRDA